jgi:hypothetical protein
MGVIGRVLGGEAAVAALGSAVREVAETFVPNATRDLELAAEAQRAALDQHGAEFAIARPGRFDSLVNGLNRLPRPMLALGTLGLFVHAMVDPASFAVRMQGLAHVPEPLWWLLGAIVAFYFGARETHYMRVRGSIAAGAGPLPRAPAAEAPNAALSDWTRGAGDR